MKQRGNIIGKLNENEVLWSHISGHISEASQLFTTLFTSQPAALGVGFLSEGRS